MKTNNDGKTKKKAYDMPKLKEWGTLTKLTHGGGSGVEDLPADGGSGPAFAPPWVKQ